MPSDRIERNHKCNIDLVACIDVTSGMAGQLDALGTYLLSLRERVERRMTECSCTIGLLQLRVRVIAFRDYGVDEAPMLASRFFVLNGANGPQPAEREALRAFLDTIGAQGGGDEPENALEALALAMQSDWTRAGAEGCRRHVIILCTDAPALPLRSRADAAGYPAGMPADLDELREWWEGEHARMERRAKRLVIYAPDAWPWTETDQWSNVYRIATAPGYPADFEDDIFTQLIVPAD